MNTIKVFKLA